MADCKRCRSYCACKKAGITNRSIAYCSGYEVKGKMRYPKIWIKDNITGNVFQFGETAHDALYVDELGRLQYINLQCCMSTQFKERIYEDKRSLYYPYSFIRYDEESKEIVDANYLHKNGLDKYICLLEWHLSTITHNEEIEFKNAEEKKAYYESLKEECENQIRLAQIEIDRGNK